jgi:hypothetical protein
MDTTKEACFHSVVDTKFKNSTHSQGNNDEKNKAMRRIVSVNINIRKMCFNGASKAINL